MESKDSFKNKPFFYWEEFCVWISSFGLKYPFFNSYIDNSELSNMDRHFIRDLDLLFYKVDDYAKNNYLDSIKEDNREGYYVCFGDLLCEIGKFEDSFYCFVLDDSISSFIDFDYVITGKRLESSLMIDKKLDMLSEMIDVLYCLGIPTSFISDRVDSKIRDISSHPCKKKLR